jgi:hypothetical protein
MHRDNTPTFNSGNRKVVNFKDFIQNPSDEKEELKDIKKSFTKNDKEIGLKQHKYKFNKVTRKMDDLVEDEVDDRLEVFEENLLVYFASKGIDQQKSKRLSESISDAGGLDFVRSLLDEI